MEQDKHTDLSLTDVVIRTPTVARETLLGPLVSMASGVGQRIAGLFGDSGNFNDKDQECSTRRDRGTPRERCRTCRRVACNNFIRRRRIGGRILRDARAWLFDRQLVANLSNIALGKPPRRYFARRSVGNRIRVADTKPRSTDKGRTRHHFCFRNIEAGALLQGCDRWDDKVLAGGSAFLAIDAGLIGSHWPCCGGSETQHTARDVRGV